MNNVSVVSPQSYGQRANFRVFNYMRGIPEVVKMGDPRADDLVRQKRFFLSQRVASQHQVGLYVMLNVYYL